MKIPFEVGAIEALAKETLKDVPLGDLVKGDVELPWGIMAGVSAGALTVAGLAGGRLKDLVKIRDRILGVRKTSQLYVKRWGGILRVLWNEGESIYHPGPLRDILEEAIDLEAARAPGAPRTMVGWVDLFTGKYQTAGPHEEDFLNSVMASASLPGLFPGIRQGMERRMDGGIRNVTPLADVLRAGAEEVDIVLASPLRMYPGFSKPDAIVSRLTRALAVMGNEVFVNDLREMNMRNVHPADGDVVVKTRVVMPRRHWSTGTLDVDPDLMAEAYRDGLEKGREPITLEEALRRR
jgi:predicted acylesterase/phospholipase RssA